MAFMNTRYRICDEQEIKEEYINSIRSKIRNKDLEKIIYKYPKYCIPYVETILKRRWFPLEKELLKRHGANNANYILSYCRKIIKGRWERAEAKIIVYPSVSYLYSLYVVKGRWELGERAIVDDPTYSYLYAKLVLGDYFEQGHDIIMESDYREEYSEFLIDINKPEFLL